MRIRVKNWEQFQHYKERTPPWIKLHKSLLDDYKFHCLPVASRALAPCIWLLASESDDGSVAHDPEMIAFRLRMSVKEVEAAIEPLVSAGFLTLFHDASEPLAESKQDAGNVLSLARSREAEAEAEKKSRGSPLDGFDAFWAAYPKKRSKGDAEKAWSKLRPSADLQAVLLRAVAAAVASADWRKESGKYIPYPASWLNAKGWEDSVDAPVVGQRLAV